LRQPRRDDIRFAIWALLADEVEVLNPADETALSELFDDLHEDLSRTPRPRAGILTLDPREQWLGEDEIAAVLP
jgi:hypothetical protein